MVICAVLMMVGQIRVEAPAYSHAWQGPPARFEVGADVVAASVFDEATSEAVPAKVQQHRDKRYVFWTRADDGTQPHVYRIIPNPEGPQTPPVFVGAEDMLDYGRSSVVADLGDGLWSHPSPVDWDGDGDWDIVNSCPDKPQSSTYVYLQNRSGVFERGERLGEGVWFGVLGDVNGDGKLDMLAGNDWYDDIRANGMSKKMESPVKPPKEKLRNFITRQADWDGDGLVDIIASTNDWERIRLGPGLRWDGQLDERAPARICLLSQEHRYGGRARSTRKGSAWKRTTRPSMCTVSPVPVSRTSMGTATSI